MNWSVLVQIPVHITESVDWIDGHHHLSQVELSHVPWDTITKLTQQRQQISTDIVIHDQILQSRRGETLVNQSEQMNRQNCTNDKQKIMIYEHRTESCVKESLWINLFVCVWWKNQQKSSQQILMVSTANTITIITNHQFLTIKTIQKWFSVVCFGTYIIRNYWV